MKASKLVEIFSAYNADEEFIVDWLGKEEFEDDEDISDDEWKRVVNRASDKVALDTEYVALMLYEEHQFTWEK
jgi:hypothetical protein